MLNSSTTSLPTPKANDVCLADDVFCERKGTSIEKDENHVGTKLMLSEEVANTKVIENKIQCETIINKELAVEEPTALQVFIIGFIYVKSRILFETLQSFVLLLLLFQIFIFCFENY